MVMRIWDGVTDPFVGYMVDKTNGRFGKNRPFMILGNVILAVTSFVMFHVTHLLPEGARFIFFIVVACVYYLGSVLLPSLPRAAWPMTRNSAPCLSPSALCTTRSSLPVWPLWLPTWLLLTKA